MTFFTVSLSAGQKGRLADLEQTVRDGLSACQSVLVALAEIYRDGLYRGTHADFRAYCRDRFGGVVSRARVYQLASAAEVVAGLPGAAPNERQARELAKWPEGERAAVWEGMPTSNELERMSKRALEALPPEKQLAVVARHEAELAEREAVEYGEEKRAEVKGQLVRLLRRVRECAGVLPGIPEPALVALEKWVGEL